MFKIILSMKSPEMLQPEEEISALKNEHLREDVKPIMVCLDCKINSKDFLEGNYKNIDFFAKEEYLKKNNLINAGEKTYVISPIDEDNKFSSEYHDCTGVVGSGISKETGRPISFLSHQDPYEFSLSEEPIKERFKQDIQNTLEKLKEICEPETIDIVVFGGKYQPGQGTTEDYLAFLEIISILTKENLSMEPTVVGGPKTGMFEADAVFFDNKERRLYLAREDSREEEFRPKKTLDADFYRDFTIDDLDKRKNDWEK